LILLATLLYYTKECLFEVESGSMISALIKGDIVICNKIGAHSCRGPYYKNDEIIIFQSPQDPRELLIKRIIGSPGDTVEIASNQIQLFPDSCLISRHFGLVPFCNIYGVAKRILLSFDQQKKGMSKIRWTRTFSKVR
jgi:signal peptidase I